MDVRERVVGNEVDRVVSGRTGAPSGCGAGRRGEEHEPDEPRDADDDRHREDPGAANRRQGLPVVGEPMTGAGECGAGAPAGLADAAAALLAQGSQPAADLLAPSRGGVGGLDPCLGWGRRVGRLRVAGRSWRR